MKAESTIRNQLKRLEKAKAVLPLYDRATDQAYGAIEALRWILGDGPPLDGLAVPLNEEHVK